MAEVAEVSADDEFGEAFDEAVAEDGGEEEAPTKEAEGPEGKAEEQEEEIPAEEPNPEEAEGEPEKKEAEKEPAKEDPESGKIDEDEPEETLETISHKYSTLQGMFNSLDRKHKDLEGQFALNKGDDKEGVKGQAEEQEETKEKPVIEAAIVLEEIGKLDSVKGLKEEYGDEMTNAFNDVANTLVTMTNQAVAGLSKEIMGKFGQLSDVVDPLQDSHLKSEEESHASAILEAHPDIEEIVEKGDIREWIEEQPEYKRKMYTDVYNDGATKDVIDLFTTFKTEKGLLKAEAPAEEEDAEAEKAVDKEKQEKLEDMEAIETKKSPVSEGKGGVGKNNYDAAWEEA